LDASASEGGSYIIGNDGANVIKDGAGDDQITTGAGDDDIDLSGGGNNHVEVTGPGVKTITAGEGSDTIHVMNSETDTDPSDDSSNTTISNLGAGDKIRLDADVNGDGTIDADDFQSITEDSDGNTVFTLSDGTSFTLEGISYEQAENIEFSFGVDAEGNTYLDLNF
jgi:hypothetical protein